MKRLTRLFIRSARRLARLIRQRWAGRPAAPKRVVLLVIATNKYFRLVRPLLASADKHFLPGHDYEVLLFTNLDKTAECAELVASRSGRTRGQVRVRHIEHEPWPMMALLRFRFFTEAAEEIRGYDYAFYTDSDMLFVADVGDEILGAGLTAVRHCGFYDQPRHSFTYETRPESLAHIPADRGLYYFAGGFQGGTAKAYADAAAVCSSWTDQDLSRGVVAVWHDESHWNAFLCRHPENLTILDPGYCLGEGMRTEYPAMILALNKNHAEIRSET